MSQLYASVTGIAQSDIISISVNTSHGSAVAVATIDAITTSLEIGDYIEVDLGYDTAHGKVFTGYVKQIERKVPDDTFVITANDSLIRAVDFFIVPSNPEDSFKRRNIKAEDLVRDVIALSGLTNYTYDATFFTFAINQDVEVKLISAYDFSRMIGDIITWHLWADQNGQVHFENRKPYVMTGTTGQPGDVADTPMAFTLADTNTINLSRYVNEKNLRNKVVVWGADGIYAEASAVSPYLPAGFYKTVLVSAPELIGAQSVAQDAADYNLNLLNRLTIGVNANCVGNHNLTARRVITLNITSVTPSITGLGYLFTVEHAWGKEGYSCNLDIRL